MVFATTIDIMIQGCFSLEVLPASEYLTKHVNNLRTFMWSVEGRHTTKSVI